MQRKPPMVKNTTEPLMNSRYKMGHTNSHQFTDRDNPGLKTLTGINQGIVNDVNKFYTSKYNEAMATSGMSFHRQGS